MKVVFIVWAVLLVASTVTDILAIRSGRKNRESKDRLIEALFANRDAQRDQIKELRRKSAALEHLLDLCIDQEKKKEERHDRAENAGDKCLDKESK